ncbi:hypothetical protein KC19_3G158600 [Ceratodon purpureus]|uniref:CST complex subunit TEN1 n=1 Tax=Ceratodon purpureus TaxID=3225 RepID=A0A8T0ILE2_CERPU|nr:hypothetical protein KC19_3G158600 [Ceratodon purpureus]KAG0583727.1 hypothetical protein KC19_3G158600 [Ceratodon purpureus]KAG0583728.1 hypothetical protein KC19_3G158600 [Ceratodon purpureus]
MAMAMVAPVSPGVVVRLHELHSASPYVASDQSLRVLGSLERFDAASGIAVLTDGGSALRVDLQHLRALPLRVGSLFEFIGELEVNPVQELTLKARVGRNVDGMDLRLFDKVLQFRRKFEEEFRTS